MKKILFITHDASRTGAPIVLLYFIKWLKQNYAQYYIDILALKGGELEEDFRKAGDNFTIKPQNSSLPLYGVIKKNFLGFLGFDDLWIKEFAQKNYSVIYANTVSSLPVASQILSYCNSKLICHVHELETVIQLVLPTFDMYINKISFFIAASNLVRKNLIDNHKVLPGKVNTIYEFSPMEVIGEDNKELNNFTVGTSGTLHWRKGGDIFLQVCRYLNKNYPYLPIHFNWVGSLPVTEKLIMDEDIRKLGLQNKLSFKGPTSDPYNSYKSFDVFLLTSREDPFPLVCIEVGRMGIPIICFEDATGTTEILKIGGGTIVPYLSIEEMAEQIVKYYEDRELLCRHGRESRKLFSKFTPAEICPQIYNSLNIYLESGN
ncbi:glycosyltransferase [Salinimicrobium sp. WS361]|uniref:glycosyltransferase n=1 Tax=Salinimicrobium sp. WS361 TaxID=3425123 RepID=UPI003D6F561D